jgi:hypothetical protein
MIREQRVVEYPEKFSDDEMIVNRIGVNFEDAEDRLRNEVEGIHAVRIKGVPFSSLNELNLNLFWFQVIDGTRKLEGEIEDLKNKEKLHEKLYKAKE